MKPVNKMSDIELGAAALHKALKMCEELRAENEDLKEQLELVIGNVPIDVVTDRIELTNRIQERDATISEQQRTIAKLEGVLKSIAERATDVERIRAGCMREEWEDASEDYEAVIEIARAALGDKE